MPAALINEATYTFSAEGIGNTFWSVSTSGRVWKTTDKGLHWNAYQTEENEIDYSNLKMRDALHGIWGVHDELYRTDDGAETFTEVVPSGTWFTNDLAFVPGTASTYVSTGGNDFDGYGALHGTGVHEDPAFSGARRSEGSWGSRGRVPLRPGDEPMKPRAPSTNATTRSEM